MTYWNKDGETVERVRLDEEHRRSVGEEPATLPRIYIFANSGRGTGMVSMTALTEDGEFIAGHLCSNESWGWHDMGLDERDNWKHDGYRERYPGGFTLVWVPTNPKDHAGIMAAHAKHVAAGQDGTPWQREREAAKKAEPASP